MKFNIKLSIALVMSLLLVACSGGGGDSVKMVKVWKISEEKKYDDAAMTNLKEHTKNYYDNNGLLQKKEFIDLPTGLVNKYYEYIYINGVVSEEKHFVRKLNPLGDYKPDIMLTMDDQGTVKFFYSGFTHAYKNTYDTSTGKLKKREQDDSNGSLSVDYIMDYTFNDDNTVEVIEKRIKKNEIFWRKFTYNNEGNLESVETRRDSSAGVAAGRRLFESSDEDGDGRVDKLSYTTIKGSQSRMLWVKTFKWEEYTVTEASTKQAVKGCRVKLGGCVFRQQSDPFGLPVMNYGK